MSVIDHFFVNPRLLDLVQAANPIHLGDNPSRHSPIVMKLRLPPITLKAPRPDIIRPRKPAWYKASEEQINSYTNLLNSKLNSMPPPESLNCHDINCKREDHHLERDKLVIDTLCSMIETSYTCLPMSGRLSGNQVLRKQSVQGWAQFVAPFKKDSLFWHSIWLSAGRPTSGGLYQVMCHTRAKYHRAVKWIKRQNEIERANNIADAAKLGDAALVQELKRSINSKSSAQFVPSCLEGKVGTSEIVEEFRICYENLYNSADSKSAMKKIKAKLNLLIDNKSQVEVSKITGEKVKEACTYMRPGKADISESFSSDAILNAPDQLFHVLAAIFRSFLVHGTITVQLLSCAFIPLFKGGLKNPESFDSYRAIAGASLILKLFEYVILNIWGDLLQTDSMQFGFKAGMSTTQCSWLVLEVGNYFMRRGTSVNACLLDCSKAFDKCRYDKLFQKLIDRDFPPIVIRVLIFAYEEQAGCVKLGGLRSHTFRISNGTRQGSVLSPALFSIYLDNLLVTLRKMGLGCQIGGLWYGACSYADDLVLLAPNRDVLQKMIQVCEQYAMEHNLNFSTDSIPSKSKTICSLLCGKQKKVKYPDPVILNGEALPWVESADHLGHIIV